MNAVTTRGITVAVEVFFQEEYSEPQNDKFVFAYRIHISNNSSKTVQLLRRHWVIKDVKGIERDIEGEGVIGKQPVMEPGEGHEYVSWAPINAEIGVMKGTYLMLDLDTKKKFRVKVPDFTMMTRIKQN